MTSQFLNTILLLLSLFVFSSCNKCLDKEEKMLKQIVEQYTLKYEFYNKPFYEPMFDEFYNDTLHRYYWELDKNMVKSHLDKFSIFDSESLLMSNEDSNYKYFGLIFDKNGRVTDEGFFDENLSFTGINYWYNEKGFLSKKYLSKLDNRFYKVNYQLENNGNVIDSSYNYYPIINFDTDTFEGPSLSICFEVQVIIDTKKYRYEDFPLFYIFYDTPHYENTKLIDGEKDRILENLLQESSDGYFFFCHDLDVFNHLMMAFGVLVEPGISDQNLSFGTYHGPVFNTNIYNTKF